MNSSTTTPAGSAVSSAPNLQQQFPSQQQQTPLNVNMEVTDEYMVQEIYPDGTEIYKQPLTMSEDFTRIIQRIDFDKLSTALNDHLDNPQTQSKNLFENDDFEIPEVITNVSSFVNPAQRQPVQFAPNSNASNFESIRSKIMNALTNISVMHDVIKIGKEQDFLVIDRVAKDVTAKQEEKPITVLVAKKKALLQASAIISTAYERLQSEQSQASRNRMDFHSELLAMRQSWRLRKRGSNILGDLSYRSAGSSSQQPGTIEVVRNDNQTPTNPSSLKIIIPKSLEGGNFFAVRTNKDSNFQFSNLFEPLKLHQSNATPSLVEPAWQHKLENIQNMLFNNELFSRLARESVQLKLPIPTIAAGNQIIATLFPGLQLSINLCHTTSSTGQSSSISSTSNQPTNESVSDPNAVLEHTLHQLLHEIHYRNLHHPLPHPTSATLAINSARYFAGPRAYDKKTLTQLSHNETILEQVIAQGQHSMLRLRTMCLIDSLAIEVQDPLIVPFWNYLNSQTKTSVRIDLYSYGYEGLTGCRTSVMLHIGTRTVKAILRDGRVLNLSFESQELRHLLLNLISQHQIAGVQALGKAMGWKVISMTPLVGVGRQEPISGTASAIVLLSPNGSRILSVKSGPHSGIKVRLSTAPQEFYPNSLVTDQQWEQLNGPFKTVDWQRMAGKTFINKMEFLMACLVAKQ